MNYKKSLLKLIQVLISVLLICYVIKKVDLIATVNVLGEINLIWLIIPLFLFIINIFLTTFRWNLILKKFKINTRFSSLLQLNYISFFFSQFLPSRFGGDIVKGYYSFKENKNVMASSLSIVSDRIAGVTAFIVLNLISLIVGFKILAPWIIALTLGIDITLIIILLIISRKGIIYKIKILKTLLEKIKVLEKVEKTYSEIKKIKDDKNLLVDAFFISLLANIMFIFINYTYSELFNFNISLIYFIIFIPIIVSITLLPISFNGIGLREYLVILLFGTVGLSVEQALALGIINRLVLIIHSAIGGGIYLRYIVNKK
jgi:glycosyltransferase 2 family protein